MSEAPARIVSTDPGRRSTAAVATLDAVLMVFDSPREILPHADLMRLSGCRVPGETHAGSADTVGAALFADLTDDEREELLEYLAWYRTRRRSARGAGSAA